MYGFRLANMLKIGNIHIQKYVATRLMYIYTQKYRLKLNGQSIILFES